MTKRAWSSGWTVLLSVGTHAAGVGLVALSAYWGLGRAAEPAPLVRTPRELGLELELPVTPTGALLTIDTEMDPVGAVPPPSAGALEAKLDAHHEGKGGDQKGGPARNLADRDESLAAETDVRNTLDVSQTQRLKTSRIRQTREDRRSVREPMQLTFVAMGTGGTLARVQQAARPSLGSTDASRPSAPGSVLGADSPASQSPDAEGASARSGSEHEGARAAQVGRGVRQGTRGVDHHAGADAAHARPSVPESTPSIAASNRGRPSDDVESTQAVAAALRSIVHASVAGGQPGEGRGGAGAGALTGEGGTAGAGARSAPLGAAQGVWDLRTQDPRFMGYFRGVQSKLDPFWRDAFPKSAVAELRQGTVIIEFTIDAQGCAQVLSPVRRPSGIDEFDRNCADAIRRASPFAPPPAELSLPVRIRATFAGGTAVSWAPAAPSRP